jgi:hypothetical protein
VGDAEVAGDLSGLGSFTGAGRSQEDDAVHHARPTRRRY